MKKPIGCSLIGVFFFGPIPSLSVVAANDMTTCASLRTALVGGEPVTFNCDRALALMAPIPATLSVPLLRTTCSTTEFELSGGPDSQHRHFVISSRIRSHIN